MQIYYAFLVWIEGLQGTETKNPKLGLDKSAVTWIELSSLVNLTVLTGDIQPLPRNPSLPLHSPDWVALKHGGSG